MNSDIPPSTGTIVDFEIDLREHWHQVPLADGPESRRWASDLGADPKIPDERRTALVAELERIRERLVRMDDPLLTAAVYLPDPAAASVGAVLGFELTERGSEGTPEEFEAFLMGEGSTSVPGMAVRDSTVWRSDIDAGVLVAQNSIVAHREPGDEFERLEERVLFGVFPTGAAEMIQFMFSTEDFGAFENMARQTEEIVASLQVALETTG